MRFFFHKLFLLLLCFSFCMNPRAETTRYAGVGLSVDAINPYGKYYLIGFLYEKFATWRGPEYSPQIFGGIQTSDFIEGVDLRFQGGVDFHTVHLNCGVGENILRNIIDFHYTFGLGAQALKNLYDKVDGYAGLKVLATRTHAVNFLYAEEVWQPLSQMRKFVFGLSPNVGLIYRCSDQLFLQLEAHAAFYQPFRYSAILAGNSYSATVRPRWAGVSVGIGWHF